MQGLASGSRNVTDSDLAGFKFPWENFVFRETTEYGSVCVCVCVHILYTLSVYTYIYYVYLCVYMCIHIFVLWVGAHIHYVCIHYIDYTCVYMFVSVCVDTHSYAHTYTMCV